jgi:hypothetical protein
MLRRSRVRYGDCLSVMGNRPVAMLSERWLMRKSLPKLSGVHSLGAWLCRMSCLGFAVLLGGCGPRMESRDPPVSATAPSSSTTAGSADNALETAASSNSGTSVAIAPSAGSSAAAASVPSSVGGAGNLAVAANPAGAAANGGVAALPVPALEEPPADGHNRLSREELETGWIRLFDGHTLFGWQPNNATDWAVDDGVIVGSGETPGLLCTTTRWSNYEFRCDYQVADGANSGVFLRTPLRPQNPAADCYELNICDTHPAFKTASLVGRCQPMSVFTAGTDWHRFSVTVDGPRVTVKCDDQLLTEYTDDAAQPLSSGFIGLQMNGGIARFRNVFLRPLGLTDLFDGKTLSGWREVPGSASTFAVNEGTIHIRGGRGFLETERSAADFILQFEARTEGTALNSGVFFRAWPGTEAAPSHGYEFQIHSGTRDGDRNRAADFGTGAIFRRQPARRVLSNDRAWFTATLVADGPRFTTWVDGVPVVDWTDERPAHENPREGLRLAAGHFSLQGHDPTTDLAFRRIRLVELPATSPQPDRP